MAANPPQPQKRRYKLNTAALLAVLALAYLSFAFVTDSLPDFAKNALGIKPEAVSLSNEFAQNYSDRLINFTEPDYGFNITYPIGYAVESDPDTLTPFRATAGVPGSSSEVIEVQVSNASFSDSDFAQVVQNANASEVQSSQKVSYAPNPFYTLDLKTQGTVTDETLYLREAFYNCKYPDGMPYSAAMVIVVPQLFSTDLELANFVRNSFEC